MKKSIRNKWLKALRSDEYEQGRGQLAMPVNEHDAFCCLGVLCDVLGEEFEEDSSINWQGLGVSRNGSGLEHYGLPPRILKKTGLSEKQSGYLSRMNDGDPTDDGIEWKEQSFTQIANWIEKHL